MALIKIVDNAYLIKMGSANAVLLDDGLKLTLVDAGFPNKQSLVFEAIRSLGRLPSDLQNLVFTHHHPDHIGSAAAIVRETGATTWMHPLDRTISESGGPFRPMTRAPGVGSAIAFSLFWRPNARFDPVKIDRTLQDGDTLPIAGGLKVIETPGHCAGHVSLLWGGERLLIVGDVGMNLFGLGDPIGFENEPQGRLSQRKLASLRYGAAAFGHGPPILSGASDHIRQKWG